MIKKGESKKIATTGKKTVKKAIISVKPSAKTVASTKPSSKPKSLARKGTNRIQTGEGWKRDMLKASKTKKTTS